MSENIGIRRNTMEVKEYDFSFKQNIDQVIENLALSTEIEARRQNLNIVKRINFDLNSFKVQESKKRMRV